MGKRGTSLRKQWGREIKVEFDEYEWSRIELVL
jgi:hypothetical protein